MTKIPLKLKITEIPQKLKNYQNILLIFEVLGGILHILEILEVFWSF